MIEFFTLEPDRLNLNGDQANIFVLRQRLKWLGLESRLTAIDSGDFASVSVNLEAAPTGKFLLIGHGSQAAMQSFAEHAEAIRNAVLRLAQSGFAGLAIGSGYELLCPDFRKVPRVSDYADIEAQADLPRTFGYINSDTNLPVISKLGESFIGTMVHGPVLARTPELADQFLKSLGVQVSPNDDSVEADRYAEGARAH
jgi:CobQ-like glutamine amidotransferase family enzyme